MNKFVKPSSKNEKTVSTVSKLEEFKFAFNIHLQLERTNKSFDPEFDVMTRTNHVLILYNLVKVYCVNDPEFKKNDGSELIKGVKDLFIRKAINKINVVDEAKYNIKLIELHSFIIEAMQRNNLGLELSGIMDLDHKPE